MSLLSELVSSLLAMPDALAEAAGVDPLSAGLLTVGGLIMVVSLGFFALLVGGAGLNLLRPGGDGREYPQAR